MIAVIPKSNMTFLADKCSSGVEEAAVEELWLNFRSTKYQSKEVKLVIVMTKDTIRDGGSTALYTVYTVHTVQTALHCLNSSMYMPRYIVREGKTLLDCYDY